MPQTNHKCLMLLDKVTNKLYLFLGKDLVDVLDLKVGTLLVFLSPSRQH
jgi:hypothetical protein